MRIVLAGPGLESGLSAFTREDLVRICEARFGKTFPMPHHAVPCSLDGKQHIAPNWA